VAGADDIGEEIDDVRHQLLLIVPDFSAPDEAGGPSVASGGPHLLDVFVRGKHHHELVHRHWDGQTWSGWINLGGDLAAGPAVISGGPHLLDVFVRGKHNDELVHRYWDGQTWSGWINLGGDIAWRHAIPEVTLPHHRVEPCVAGDYQQRPGLT
jgi:hypothetical protein